MLDSKFGSITAISPSQVQIWRFSLTNTMLAAATSFFARTAISQSYNFGDPSTAGSRSSTPGPASTSNSPQTAPVSLHIGLWKVQGAYHRVTNKRVAVWSFDKRGPDTERLGPLSKERILEVLKAEVRICPCHDLYQLFKNHRPQHSVGCAIHPSSVSPVINYAIIELTVNVSRNGRTARRNTKRAHICDGTHSLVARCVDSR